MTLDQAILFGLLFVIFAMLVWGRFRYDLVAFAGLVIALILEVVPTANAFAGFGHPATVVIALVLIISRGLSNSGVVEWIAEKAINPDRSLPVHIGIMSVIAGALSAVMNNVAALALLMPVDLEASAKSNRSPALSLMPLSFASILGGMVTLIGTPPNIIIAAFRGKAVGEPFSMFDFAPVGLACAVAGTIFVAGIGWRLIPRARAEHNSASELFELGNYVAELEVGKGSTVLDKTISEWEDEIEDDDLQILGVMRAGQRLPGRARRTRIAIGDILIVEAPPETLEKVSAALGCQLVTRDDKAKLFEAADLQMREVVVREDAFVSGRSPARITNILHRHGVSLLGMSRQGKHQAQYRRTDRIAAGDILLLVGGSDSLDELTQRLGLLPLAERGLTVVQRRKAGLAVGFFALAIGAATFGLIDLPIALGAAAVLYAFTGIVPARELYDSVEWSVIVLLGALIPIGGALESSGGTGLMVEGLLGLTQGQSPVVVLTVLMIITMTLSDVLNNTATAVIAAPIAIEISSKLGVSPDPFLMAVAVAASCAFLTPIGHKNNTLILGPGGYRFGDYWRMGLPLEILIVAVSIPMILIVWPIS